MLIPLASIHHMNHMLQYTMLDMVSAAKGAFQFQPCKSAQSLTYALLMTHQLSLPLDLLHSKMCSSRSLTNLMVYIQSKIHHPSPKSNVTLITYTGSKRVFFILSVLKKYTMKSMFLSSLQKNSISFSNLFFSPHTWNASTKIRLHSILLKLTESWWWS